LDTACEKKKYEAFDCRSNGEGKNFPEKYSMIDNVKGFRIVRLIELLEMAVSFTVSDLVI